MAFESFQNFAQSTPFTRDFRDYSELFGTINEAGAARAQELQRASESLFQGRVEGLTSGFREFDRSNRAALQSQGVNPSFAQRVVDQQRGELPEQFGIARGETQAQLHTGLSGLIGEQAESLTSLGLTQKQQALQEYLAKQARKAAKKGFLVNTLGSVLGLGINAFALKGLGLFGGGGGEAAGGTSPFAGGLGYANSAFPAISLRGGR